MPHVPQSTRILQQANENAELRKRIYELEDENKRLKEELRAHTQVRTTPAPKREEEGEKDS